jgi:hypothetical protein
VQGDRIDTKVIIGLEKPPTGRNEFAELAVRHGVSRYVLANLAILTGSLMKIV